MTVYNGQEWTQSEGEDQYRRGVYTFIKRTSPYPSMITFDGSSREVCLGRRIRTNTPLQALVTLNDSVFVDASRALAKQMTKDKASPREAISDGYWRLTFREMSAPKLSAMSDLYKQALQTYSADTAAAHAITADRAGTTELAAMTVVANALLNLDEVVMKE